MSLAPGTSPPVLAVPVLLVNDHTAELLHNPLPAAAPLMRLKNTLGVPNGLVGLLSPAVYSPSMYPVFDNHGAPIICVEVFMLAFVPLVQVLLSLSNLAGTYWASVGSGPMLTTSSVE